MADTTNQQQQGQGQGASGSQATGGRGAPQSSPTSQQADTPGVQPNQAGRGSGGPRGDPQGGRGGRSQRGFNRGSRGGRGGGRGGHSAQYFGAGQYGGDSASQGQGFHLGLQDVTFVAAEPPQPAALDPAMDLRMMPESVSIARIHTAVDTEGRLKSFHLTNETSHQAVNQDNWSAPSGTGNSCLRYIRSNVDGVCAQMRWMDAQNPGALFNVIVEADAVGETKQKWDQNWPKSQGVSAASGGKVGGKASKRARWERDEELSDDEVAPPRGARTNYDDDESGDAPMTNTVVAAPIQSVAPAVARCENCNAVGHHKTRCMLPGPTGYLEYCPLHEEGDEVAFNHSIDQCSTWSTWTDELKYKALVLDRSDLPTYRCTGKSWVDYVVARLPVAFGHPYLPWLDSFGRGVRGDNKLRAGVIAYMATGDAEFMPKDHAHRAGNGIPQFNLPKLAE